MGQVVQTIHAYQTAGGPTIEARISDPNLGDVKLVVTGRAGEIVQAQLTVGSRVSADALTAAAARVHATSDALAGVNVTVRSETGNSWTGGRGANSEAAAWTAADGWGSGSGSAGGGHGSQGAGSGNPAGSGNGAAGSGNGAAGSGTQPDGSRSPNRPPSSPFDRLPAGSDRARARSPLPGGSTLDIRA